LNKNKIINDPVFGFISIQSDLLYDIVTHPYFQRLNRIKQLGLASVVYPGAQHTRFQHSLGAMYLMSEAIKNLRSKGHDITDEEADGALAIMLLHDIGHGPLSHSLEQFIVTDVDHENITLFLVNKINQEFNGRLNTALSIFKNEHPKKFLHQLVSGQLDTDRLDYLRRDSFFTGVVEGNIGSARIIRMLNVYNGELVLEAKGTYSIEQYLLARRLMYWQVYFHKTCIAAENMLTNTIKRAKELSLQGKNLGTTPSLEFFLKNTISQNVFFSSNDVYKIYTELDDSDIWCSLKSWSKNEDYILSTLSKSFLNRKIFKTKVSTKDISEQEINEKKQEIANKLGISFEDAAYFVSLTKVSTKLYDQIEGEINVLHKDSVKHLSESSDILSSAALSEHVSKHYFSFYEY